MTAFGTWRYADGMGIPIFPERQGLFYDNRGMSAVRLNRVGSGVRPFSESRGMFGCEIPDADNVMQQIFVGMYPPDGKLHHR